MTSKKLKFFRMETDKRGIMVVTFDRPPVNAVSFEVYPEIREMAETIEATDETRVVVLTAPPNARAWCGGAVSTTTCLSTTIAAWRGTR